MKTTCLTKRCLGVLLGALIALPAVAEDAGHRTVELTADAESGRLMPIGDEGSGSIVVPIGPRAHFWADPVQNKILRGDLSGRPLEEIASGLNTPYGLGFDSQSQLFVWTSSGDEVMQTVAPHGGNVRSLNTSFDSPPAIEIPGEGVRQAITVVGSDVVRVTVDEASDESRTEVLLSLAESETVHGLAMDAEMRLLYVGNAVGMAAYRVDLDAQTVTRLAFTDHVAPIADADEGELQ